MDVDSNREKRPSPEPHRQDSTGKKLKEEDSLSQRLHEEEDKRRELRFKVDDLEDDMTKMAIQNEKFRYNASRLTELVLKMADLEQGTNVTLVKKKGT